MKRLPQLRIALLVVLAALGAFAPWGAAPARGTWIALASVVASHRIAASLESASQLVTAMTAGVAALAAVVRVVAQRRGGMAVLRAFGLLGVCVPLALLMPMAGAVCFLVGCGAVLLFDFWQGRSAAAAPLPQPWSLAITRELFAILSAGAFLAFGWQYNAHLLLRLILVAAGLALVARGALLPGRNEPELLPSSSSAEGER